MRNFTHAALASHATGSIEAGISADAMKAINKQVEHIRCDIEDDVMYRLKDELAPSLVAWVVDMAKRTVEQILEGNEDQMRRYLSCEKRGDDNEYYGWTGRHNPKGWAERDIVDKHPIIHGTLFEQGAVALRSKIVDAHADLIKNERILDLEDQVKSLVAQVNRANAAKDALWDRLGHLETR